MPNAHSLLTALFALLLPSLTLLDDHELLGGFRAPRVESAEAAPNVFARRRSTKFFYVAPNGSDQNPGTEDKPWKSIAKVAASLRAGQSAIFEDGTYIVTDTVWFRESGTASKRINVRARNQHKAHLMFRGLTDRQKLVINGARYVTIEGFDITQDRMGRTWSDRLVECIDGADNCQIIGNRIHGAMEAIKTRKSSDVVFKDNYIYDANIGIGTFNALAPIVTGNTIENPVSDGIQTKGGTRRAQVTGNHILTTGSADSAAGIVLGGVSCVPGCDVYDSGGYENYESRASNNHIEAGKSGSIEIGLLIQGCDSCTFSNNVVVGAQTGIATIEGGGRGEGWKNETLVRNPVFAKNKIRDCTERARDIRSIIGELRDSNRYSGCPAAP